MELTTPCAIVLTMTVWLDSVCSMPAFWCPVGRYPAENGRCDICYDYCGEEGCTGPGSHLGDGGCSSCWLGLERHHDNVECMSPFLACPNGYYRKRSVHHGKTVTRCKPCHPLCKTCTGAGISNCESCRFFRWDGQCVRGCPFGSTIRNGNSRTCLITGATYTGSRGNRRHISRFLLPYRDRVRQNK